MRRIVTLLAVCLLGSTAASAQSLPQPSRTVFKCKKDGKIVYSDSPCLGAEKLEVVPTRGLTPLRARSASVPMSNANCDERGWRMLSNRSRVWNRNSSRLPVGGCSLALMRSENAASWIRQSLLRKPPRGMPRRIFLQYSSGCLSCEPAFGSFAAREGPDLTVNRTRRYAA
jgi:hypothetical protein